MSDLIMILTTAREAGFEAGTIISIGTIAFMLNRSNSKRHKEMRSENKVFWAKLISTLQGHDDKNEKRFSTIETHIGLKK